MRPAHELADRIDRLDPPLDAVVTLDLKGHAAPPMRPMPRWRVVM